MGAFLLASPTEFVPSIGHKQRYCKLLPSDSHSESPSAQWDLVTQGRHRTHWRAVPHPPLPDLCSEGTTVYGAPHDPAVSQDSSHGLPSAQYESQLKAWVLHTHPSSRPEVDHSLTSLTGNSNHCRVKHTMAQTPSQSPFPTQSVEDRGSSPARGEPELPRLKCVSHWEPHITEWRGTHPLRPRLESSVPQHSPISASQVLKLQAQAIKPGPKGTLRPPASRLLLWMLSC